MQIVLYVLAGLFVLLSLLAIIKKPGSVSHNPMEGKKVVFVENASEPMNADGVWSHLEAVGDSKPKGGLYNLIIKRLFGIILSFCGLVILSPFFL